MLNVFHYEFNICYISGCASNDIILKGQSELGLVEDNGFVRLFYTLEFYGLSGIQFFVLKYLEINY